LIDFLNQLPFVIERRDVEVSRDRRLRGDRKIFLSGLASTFFESCPEAAAAHPEG
jgi:hypothetical protein